MIFGAGDVAGTGTKGLVDPRSSAAARRVIALLVLWDHTIELNALAQELGLEGQARGALAKQVRDGRAEIRQALGEHGQKIDWSRGSTWVDESLVRLSDYQQLRAAADAEDGPTIDACLLEARRAGGRVLAGVTDFPFVSPGSLLTTRTAEAQEFVDALVAKARDGASEAPSADPTHATGAERPDDAAVSEVAFQSSSEAGAPSRPRGARPPWRVGAVVTMLAVVVVVVVTLAHGGARRGWPRGQRA